MSSVAPSSQPRLRVLIPPWLSGGWGMVGIFIILYNLVFLTWTYFHWGGEENISLIGDFAILPPLLLASLMAWRVAAQSALLTRLRKAWFFMGLSIFMNFLGNVLWTYLENVLQVQPFPSVADIFYLTSYPLMLLGLLKLSTMPENWRDHLVLWFDLILVFTTASMYVGYFLIIPTATINNSDVLSQILATAYPVWSLILIGGVLALLLRRPAESDTRVVLFLLLLGISCFLLSDLTFGYASLAGTYVVGSWIDVGWQVAQVFLVLAALRQLYQAPNPATMQGWHRVVDRLIQRIPLLAIVLGYGLVFYVILVDFHQAAVWLMTGAMLLTAFVVGQQIVSRAFANLPIRAKLILTFVLISVLSVSLVTLISYFTIRTNLEAAVGLNLKARAQDRAGAMGGLLSKQSDALEGFVLSEVLQSQVAGSNAGYHSIDLRVIWNKLRQRDLAWRAAADSDPVVQTVLNNDAAKELRKFRDNFPGYTDLLLTDKFGALLAATSRPFNYDQSTQSWWQAASHKGEGTIYMSQPIPNPGTELPSLVIVVPVRAHELYSDLTGFLMATYELQDLTELLEFSDNHPGKTSLLLPSGQIMTDLGQLVVLDQDLLEHLQATASEDFTQVYFEGKSQLVSQALVTAPASDPEETVAFERLNWSLMIHEDPDEAFAPLNAAWQITLLAIIAVLALAAGLAVILAQMLVAPISRLTAVAGQIAAGNHSTKAQVECQDEIGTLASTFNSMLEALSRTQQELQESEALYRNLVEYSPDLIALSAQGVCNFINPAGVKLLAASSVDELIGQPVLNVLSPEDQGLARQEIEDIQAANEPTSLLHRKIHRVDGTTFEAEFRAIPISNGGQPAIQFVMSDITERKNAQEKIHQLLAEVARQRDDLELRVAQRTEELNRINQRLQYELMERQQLVQSLRDRERQLAQAATLARIAYWELDLPKSEFTLNDHFYNILRTTAQTVGGYFIPAERFFRQFVHPGDADRIRASIWAAQAPSSSTGQLDYRCICGDGQIQHVFLEYQIAFDQEGRAIRVFGTHMDITERQQLAQSLSESETRFRLLFEASPDAILLIDPNDSNTSWTIVDCNEAACRMNGFKREELIGQPIDILNATPNRPGEREENLRLLRQKGILNYEAIHRNKSGHLFPVEVSTSLVTFAGRELILGIDRDITERKQTELALKDAKELAEDASRAKSEFLSRMSHELRTPMNAILGFAQLLEMSRKEPLTSSQKERVTQIVKGGQHLLDLINEILDISRIEANRLHISPEPVSIRESIQEVLDLTTPLAIKRHIQIVTRLGSLGDKPFVMADRQRLKQILLNLLSNAVKYNYDGGSVIISCEQTSLNRWHISISDTGPGISQENLSRLFVPFERLGADHPDVEGTGLGLVLAKRLIELMDGQIGVDSLLGKGSTFWIELPSAESPAEHLQRVGATGNLTMLSAAARTILYVEDNVANFELIQQVLAEYSQIELVWAADLKTGWEMAQIHHPSLILLDLHLGGMDGAEMLRQLKQNEETAEIPVVVVSADATPGQIERLLSWGAHAYLTKPLNVKHFVRLIEELLAEKVA